MCGIFAWSGLKPGQFNKHKFDILGIWNESRGEHSCGVTAEGKIRVGVKDLKVYRDFAALSEYVPRPKKIPATIGHTRHATVGEHTEDNAHPFGFGETKHGFDFVGVHNGSLVNHYELAKEYDIEDEVFDDAGKIRRKIDSEILLEIIYKTGNYKVLSKYNGAAALVWQFLEEPDIMYFYHGMSKLTPTTVTPQEERPLYYYKEHKNSLYVSSIEDSLMAIGGNVHTVGEFEFNTVYKVKNGNIADATLTKVSRVSNYQRRGATTTYNNYTQGKARESSVVPYEYVSPRMAFAQNGEKKAGPSNAHVSTAPNIYKEVPYVDMNQYNGRVYMNKLRYWRNGHRINGIWTLVKGYGFYFLGMNPKDAEAQFWNYTNKYFYDGAFYDGSKLVEAIKSVCKIPFPHGGDHREIINPPMYNFFDGIMVEHYLDFAACVGKEKSANAFSVKEISQMAKHPIMNISYASRGNSDQNIFFKGALVNGTFCPLESSRLYTFEAGNLTFVKELQNPTKIVNNLSEQIKVIELEFQEEDEETIDLNDLEAEINVQETALTVVREDKKTTYVDNDLLEEDITKVFAESFDNFSEFKKDLGRYGANPRALQAAAILTTFLNAAYQLLSVEPKQ